MLTELNVATSTNAGQDLNAAVLDIIVTWHTRGARLYAWERVCELRGDLAEEARALNKRLGEYEARIENLETILRARKR